MKTNKSLSRAEVNRRIQTLTIDAWKHLSGYISGCSVNAWATSKHRRIERISVCAVIKQGGSTAKAFAVAKQLHAVTGLCVHFHGTMTVSGTIINGSVTRYPSINGPRHQLP